MIVTSTRNWMIDTIRAIGGAVLMASLLTTPSSVRAQSSNQQYGTFNWGSYVIQNEIYNPPGGGYSPNDSNNTQSIWGLNGGWGSTWKWKNLNPTTGPGSFPSAYIGWYFGGNSSGSGGFPVTVASVNNGQHMLPTSVNYQVAGTKYDVAYDFFLDTNPSPGNTPQVEMMVWLASNGGPTPAGTKVTSGITLGNTTGSYDLWYKAPGGTPTWPILTYVRTTQATNISLYLQPFVWWALNETPWISSSQYVVGVAFGAEPYNGSGSIYVTSYSASAS